MTVPRQQQPGPYTPVPHQAQQPAPFTGQAGPGEQRVIIVQLPADQLPAARWEPTAADVAAVRGAVRRDAVFFVLLLAGVLLAVTSLIALRWAANTTTPTPAAPTQSAPATAR